MTVKIAINGFGRIGRLFYRAAYKRPEFEIVAVNDITDAKTLAHLFKYDSVHRAFPGEVKVDGENIVIDGKPIKVFAQRDPEQLPWKDLGVEYVLESTGFFRTEEKASKHIKAGARKVIISAPAKSKGVPTFVMGVNEEKYEKDKHHVVSNASCTTNCIAPVAKILHERFGIKGGLMTTIHSYTADQRLQDAPHGDLRRARAAAVSMLPTTTGAAAAVGLVIPELNGKFDGMAIRVPTPNVSLVDVVVEVEKAITLDSVKAMFKEEAAKPRWQSILKATEEPLVSSDYIGCPFSSIVDLPFLRVINNQIKVLSWYDNEMGYSHRLADLIAYMIKKE